MWKCARWLAVGIVAWTSCGAALATGLSDAEIAGRYFKPEEVERGRTLGNHRAVCLGLDEGLALLALAALALSGPGRRLTARVRPARWPRGGLAAEVVTVGGLCALAVLPLEFYRGFTLEHQLGLSTQTVGGWLGDWALERLIAGGVLVLAALVVDGLQRWSPRRWWLASWAALSAGIFIFMYLQPLLIAPLFNDYRPLGPGALRDGCTRIARDAGIPISEVYVIDASRRTRRYNAFFTGVGATRAIALHDTMVDGMTVRETLAVVGHEAGHWVHHHLLCGIALWSGAILVGLAVAARPRVLGDWPLSRPGAIARVFLIVSAVELALLPAESGISRLMEAQADQESLRLTHDPDATVTMLVALARSNVSNLLPHPLLRAWLYTHPTIPERIRMALEFQPPASAPAP